MMVSSVRKVLVMAGVVVLGQVFIYSAPAQNKSKEEKVIARIQREQNPGKKARLQLHLAKIKMTQADEAYRDRKFSEGEALLQQYLDQVRAAWTTLQDGDGGSGKYLGACKDLEIALREEDRLLEDLRHRVPYPEDEPIEAIANKSRAVHNQVLEAIFPDDSRKERSKR